VEEDRRLVETAEVVQDSPHKINYRKEYFPPNARFDKFTKLSSKRASFIFIRHEEKTNKRVVEEEWSKGDLSYQSRNKIKLIIFGQKKVKLEGCIF
jgi:hypothetical protein